MVRTVALDAEDAAPGYLTLIGARVRQFRTRRGMSRRVLAQASGVSERYLAQLETGRGNASITVLKQIANAIDIPVDDLVDTRLEQSSSYLLLRKRAREADEASLEQWLTITRERPAVQAEKRFIALVGLRGAGKSTLGRRLANALDVPFVEVVSEIEALAGLPVAEVFSLGGQVTYRRLEKAALEGVFSKYERAVIAVGGSLVSEPEAFEQLRESCTTVWVQAKPNQHMERVLAQGDHRPMANSADAMRDLKRILAERSELYGKADASIDTAVQSPHQSLSALLELPALAPFKPTKQD
jgi:XRE family transcriptional regulator, aerobic/anaerobic benzoate catabolism transcriptional regulator